MHRPDWRRRKPGCLYLKRPSYPLRRFAPSTKIWLIKTSPKIRPCVKHKLNRVVIGKITRPQQMLSLSDGQCYVPIEGTSPHCGYSFTVSQTSVQIKSVPVWYWQSWCIWGSYILMMASRTFLLLGAVAFLAIGWTYSARRRHSFYTLFLQSPIQIQFQPNFQFKISAGAESTILPFKDVFRTIFSAACASIPFFNARPCWSSGRFNFRWAIDRIVLKVDDLQRFGLWWGSGQLNGSCSRHWEGIFFLCH